MSLGPIGSLQGGDTDQPDGPGFFTDVTPTSAINFTYRNGEEAGHFDILGSLGGGVGLIDYDQDGLLDVFATGGGHFGPNKEILGLPNRLFRNEGRFRFRDVTTDAGLPVDKGPFYSHGVAVGDYDNDGWPDLLVTGYGRLVLYRNNKGKFAEVTEAAKLPARPAIWNPKSKQGHWSTSAAWCDLNGDGHLDLFVVHYVNWSFENHPHCRGAQGEAHDVCSPKQFDGLPDQLFFNNGDGTFREVNDWAARPESSKGVNATTPFEDSGRATQDLGKSDKGLGILIADLNDDGKPDIYVANDTTPNFLYINRSDGKFEEIGSEAGVALDEYGAANASMGIAAAAYDGSGRLSLFVTNYQNEHHALYRNLGTGSLGHPAFHYASHYAGISALGTSYVGWGTGFVDYDHDGNEDIVVSHGHVIRYPSPPSTPKQRPKLLRNLRKPGQEFHAVRLADVSNQAGPYFHRAHMGRGVAFGDLNNDGKTDLVITHTNEPLAILKNDAKNDHHWLGAELVGKPNRAAFGAKLTLEVGNEKLVRAVLGGGSYASAHDLRVVFGLAKEQKVGKLTVTWPSGEIQNWEGLAVDRYWRLIHGQKEAEPQVVHARGP